MDIKGASGNVDQELQRNLIGIDDPAISLYHTFRLVYFRQTLTERTMATRCATYLG